MIFLLEKITFALAMFSERKASWPFGYQYEMPYFDL